MQFIKPEYIVSAIWITPHSLELGKQSGIAPLGLIFESFVHFLKK